MQREYLAKNWAWYVFDIYIKLFLYIIIFYISKINNFSIHYLKGPAGSSYAGAQGAVGYNPNWNTGYQAWPSQPQSNDGSMILCVSFNI